MTSRIVISPPTRPIWLSQVLNKRELIQEKMRPEANTWTFNETKSKVRDGQSGLVG